MTYQLSVKGFTLIELMITVLMSSLIIAAVYSAYIANEKVHGVQNQVVEMQQNIRAANVMLLRELRSARYDPTNLAGSAIIQAVPDAISFTADFNADGDDLDPGENIAYNLRTVNGVPTLRRSSSNGTIVLNLVAANHWEAPAGGQQTAAEFIEGLEFYYTLDDGTQMTLPAINQYPRIRRIDITMVARTAVPDLDFTNNIQYNGQSGIPLQLGGANPPNDNFRRRVVRHTINLRN